MDVTQNGNQRIPKSLRPWLANGTMKKLVKQEAQDKRRMPLSIATPAPARGVSDIGRHGPASNGGLQGIPREVSSPKKPSAPSSTESAGGKPKAW